MPRRVYVAIILAGSLALFGARPAAAPQCEFQDVDRIVAVGDIHGAFDRFVEILKMSGVLDNKNKWAAGRTHLVQIGDVVDRGPDSRKAIDLLRQLTKEASSAGGRVHALLGNHEVMRILHDFRYLNAGEPKAFVTLASAEVVKQVLAAAPPEERERLQKEMPLGMAELVQAFEAGQTYGNWVRERPAVVRINGIDFVHGGISPAVASMTCGEINDTVRKELTYDFAKTDAAPLKSLVAREDGPLWYRGLAQEPDTFQPAVDEILTTRKATAMVVAHTVQTDGRVGVRYGGKVFFIDTGMQPAYMPDGRASALEIRGSRITAIYMDRNDVLAGGGGF